jgi:DNA-binding transcriptional LysR family regulator
MTQPAMSRSLARLRLLLGDPLLARVGRRVEATERGKALRGPVEEALAAARRVLEPPPEFDPGSARGELVIGLSEEGQLALADSIVRAVWAAAPNIDLRVWALSAQSLEEGRRGVIDLAIAPDLAALPGRAGAVDFSELVARPLYMRRFVVARAPETAAPTDLDSYCAAHHAIVSFEGGGLGFVDDLLAAMGRRRRVAAALSSFPSVARLVSRSALIATMPDDVVRAVGYPLQISEVPLPLPTLPMLLLWHPRFTPDARHRFLRECVTTAVRSVVGGWASSV